MKSFCDYLGLSNSCSYDVDDVIGRADRFGFQNFCSPDFTWTQNHQCQSSLHLTEMPELTETPEKGLQRWICGLFHTGLQYFCQFCRHFNMFDRKFWRLVEKYIYLI